MHGATARRVAVPHVQPVDALQRLVRTEDEAGDISREVLKAFLATKEVAKTCHSFGDCLWYPGDRQHVILLHVYALIARLAACGVGVRRRGIWTTAERPPTATPWPPFRGWALTSISPISPPYPHPSRCFWQQPSKSCRAPNTSSRGAGGSVISPGLSF